MHGDGVPRDIEEAVGWFNMAGKGGDAVATGKQFPDVAESAYSLLPSPQSSQLTHERAATTR